MTGEFEVRQWPAIRNVLELYLRAQKPYTIYGHAEFDVTKVLERLEDQKQREGAAPSLNTYLVFALSRVAQKHEKIRSYKHGQKLIVFKHVDVGLPVLKTLPNGVKVPVLYIVRRADTKSLEELDQELREAVKSDLSGDQNVKFRRTLSRLPRFVQRLTYAWIFMSPVRAKRYFGNVGITNLRHLGYSSPFIGLPPNIYSCQVSVGNVTEKFLPDEHKRPELRKVLTLAAGMDHLVMDGMCVSAIGKEFADFLSSAEGLG